MRFGLKSTESFYGKQWGDLLCVLLQVSRNIDLVYGGGSIGLMGLVSQAVHDGGRHVIG